MDRNGTHAVPDEDSGNAQTEDESQDWESSDPFGSWIGLVKPWSFKLTLLYPAGTEVMTLSCNLITRRGR